MENITSIAIFKKLDFTNALFFKIVGKLKIQLIRGCNTRKEGRNEMSNRRIL
jgi:hypothetical protein